MIEAVVIAEQEAERLANNLNKKAFVLKSVSAAVNDEINLKVDSCEAALKYLKREHCMWVSGLHDKHAEAMSAMYKLIVIAEAWNKEDEFTPDFDSIRQHKWFPWFRTQGTAGFVCVGSVNTSRCAYAATGSRLCFKSEKRAEQFGKQFIDLWNDFLLFR